MSAHRPPTACPAEDPKRRWAPVFGLYVLGIAAPACDMPNAEEDQLSVDTGTTVEEVNDESGAKSPADNDPTAVSDDDSSDDGDTPPLDDNSPAFENNPGSALDTMMGMGYACNGADGLFYNLYFDGKALHARDEDGALLDGSYTSTGQTLTLNFPDIGIEESATRLEIELDKVVRFVTPNLDCNAIYTEYNVGSASESARCPSIKYIPGVSWEDNEFVFGEGGDVKRRRWTELSGVDTLYSERFGIYLRVDDKIFMYFAGQHAREDGEQFYSGTLTDDGLYIDQLEPERGPCN